MNTEVRTVDFRNLKATDLKNNKRVIIPALDEDDVEIRQIYLKNELKEVVLKYQSEHCDKYENILDNNLNVNQLDTI